MAVVQTNNKKTVADYTEFGDKIATKEYLFKTYGFKESDLAGIDVDKVLSRFEVSEEALRESGDSKELVVENLKKLQKELDEEGKVQIKPSKPDYSYLVKAKKFTGEYPAFDDLKYLAFSHTEGTGGSSCFIDFNKDIIVFLDGSMPIYDDIDKYNEKEELSKVRKQNIISSLKEAGVTQWKYKYKVRVNNPEGDANWHLGIEFKDGTIISYSGTNDAPETLYDVVIKEIYKGLRVPK